MACHGSRRCSSQRHADGHRTKWRPTRLVIRLAFAACVATRAAARESSNPHPFNYFSDPPVVAPGKENSYGWVQSFKAGSKGLNGTEIVHLTPHAGKLFAGTSFWMSRVPAASTVVRLDTPGGTWVTETVVFPYAMRTEILKVARFSTDKHGGSLHAPVELLVAGFYLNFNGEGRCGMVVRNDATRKWELEWYYKERPWRQNYFSARALESYKDKVTGVDHIFMDAGMPGIVKGSYDPSKPSRMVFDHKTESGAFPTRPLNIVTMGGRLYTAGGSFMRRRNDGPHPTWSVVFDMSNHWSGTVDESVGGLRGITAIPHPSGKGESLLFAWCPNGGSASCMMRLDPQGESFKVTQEGCVKALLGQIFGDRYKNPYSLADYNFALPVGSGKHIVHLIGFEALLFSYSVDDLPTDPRQETIAKSGKKMAYYAGAGYLIRRGPQNYEVRVPGGPRPCPTQINPPLVAVRCYANSPWDDSVYIGGYDANFFDVLNTAWVLRGIADAVYRRPVPGSLTCTTTSTTTTTPPPDCLLCGLHSQSDAWLDMHTVDTSRSVAPHARGKAVDGNSKTWGSARTYIMDLHFPYRLSKLRIDWRSCKCSAAGAVLVRSSMDGERWKTISQPRIYDWGEHRLRTYDISFRGRYMAINITQPADQAYATFWEIALFGRPDLGVGPQDLKPNAKAKTKLGEATCQEIQDFANSQDYTGTCVDMQLHFNRACCVARGPRTIEGVMNHVKQTIASRVMHGANVSRLNSKASSLAAPVDDVTVHTNLRVGAGGFRRAGAWAAAVLVSLSAVSVAPAVLWRWRKKHQPLPPSPSSPLLATTVD